MKRRPPGHGVSLLALLACAVLLPLGLAGCTQGDPGGGGDGFEGTCPAWVKGRNAQKVDGNLALTNQTTVPDFDRWDFAEPADRDKDGDLDPGTGFGDGITTWLEHPLDFLVMDFDRRHGEDRLLYVQDAEVKVSFFASDGGYPGDPLQAYLQGDPDGAQHQWTFRSGPGGWRIENLTFRVDLARDDEQPDPRGVFVHWEMTDVDLDDDIDTASVVFMRYSPEFWYRTCSRDGTKH